MNAVQGRRFQVRDDAEEVQGGRENAGRRLDSPWPECYIQSSLRLGRSLSLLTEQGACPVHGEPEHDNHNFERKHMTTEEQRKHDPILGMPSLLLAQEVFSARKGCLWSSTVATALLILCVVLLCNGSISPDSLQEFFAGIPELLLLIIFFPAGLIWWLNQILPSGSELNNGLVMLGWGIYLIHGLILLIAKRWKTVVALMMILVLFLIMNIYGCSVMMSGLNRIH
jgi:hypothetical protein